MSQICQPTILILHIRRVFDFATGSPVHCPKDKLLEVRIAPRLPAMTIAGIKNPSFAVKRYPTHRLLSINKSSFLITCKLPIFLSLLYYSW